MKITAEGQVTIPQEIRERLGLLPDTEVEVVDDWVRVRRTGDAKTRGQRLVEQMVGRATTGLTTDEIMALRRPPEPDDDR